MNKLVFKCIWLIIFLNLFYPSYSQKPIPSSTQTKTILLLNGTAHLGNGKVIDNSVIAFKNGKITLVADATVIKLDLSKYDTIISAQGKQIYPGFIALNTTLGLIEIESVRATRDASEIGVYNPNLNSIIAYNTDSKITPTVRTNGVLLAQIVPRGGVISGTSSIVELDGWNWEDALYKKSDGLHLNWITMNSVNNEDESGRIEKSKDYEKQKADLTKFFTDAKAYAAVLHDERDLRLEAMKGIFDGTETLFIHANYVKEIIDAVNFSKSMSVKKMVLVDGKDAWMVTDLLKENNIPVVLPNIHDLPSKPEDDVKLSYKTPYLLQKAGVLFCLSSASVEMEQMQTRNLPFMAGTSVAYGLAKEEALMAITNNAAKILGIEKTVGTLEEGKDATLFISTGDALDMKTNNVEIAYIRGKKIDLNNEQKELYEKYKTKYKIK